MSPAELKLKLEQAREALIQAEDDLRRVVSSSERPRVAEETVVSDVIRNAFEQVREARARLATLDATGQKLANLTKAIDEAEQALAGVLREDKLTTGSEAKWASSALRGALTNLKHARQALVDLTDQLARDGHP
jgi:hypothetical protein